MQQNEEDDSQQQEAPPSASPNTEEGTPTAAVNNENNTDAHGFIFSEDDDDMRAQLHASYEAKQKKNISIAGTSKRERILHYVNAWIYTSTYVFIYICHGLASGAVGPTMLRFAENTNTNVDDLGWILTTRSLCAVIVGLFTGFIIDALNKRSKLFAHIYLALILLFYALVIIIIPFASQFWLLLILLGCVGLCGSSANITLNINMVWIWKEKVTPYLLFLHFTFGVGALCSPMLFSIDIQKYRLVWVGIGILTLVASVYMILVQVILRCTNKRITNEKNKRKHLTSGFGAHFHHQDELEQTGGKLRPTQSINSLQDHTSQQGSASPLPTKGPSIWDRTLNLRISLAVGMALFFWNGFEGIMTNLIFTCITRQGLSSGDRETSLMNSGYWISFTACRLLCAFISSVVPAWLLLTCEFILVNVAMLIFLLFPKTAMFTWIAIIIVGLGSAAMYPTTLGLPSSTLGIKLTAGNTSLIIFVSSFGAMIIPLITTRMLDQFFYIAFVLASGTGIMYMALFVWAFVLHRRRQREEAEELKRQQEIENKIQQENAMEMQALSASDALVENKQ